jgi:hypothetical protein
MPLTIPLCVLPFMLPLEPIHRLQPHVFCEIFEHERGANMANHPAMQNPEKRPVNTVRLGSPWTRFWWVWLVVVIGIFWVFGWGWFGYGGFWGATHTSKSQIAGSGVAVLNSANRDSFVGAEFRVMNVTVQNRINDRAYWITTPSSAPMLLVTIPQQTVNGTLNKGTRVNVTGVVEKAPTEAQAEKEWGLSAADAKRVEQQGAYVQASEVQTSQPS